MKKIVLMLLGIAATINVMAVEYTASATILLESTSGESCEITLNQSNAYGELSGYDMYMSGRKIALYVMKGSDKLQIANAANLEDVKLGLLSDASTNYTITVSDVEGAETLYIWDGNDASYALTPGAVYNFTAAANATDEARFVIKKSAMPTEQSICFRYNVLEINAHAGESLIIKQGDTEIVNIPALGAVYSKDLSGYNGRLVVTLNGQDYQIDANPAVTNL